MFYFLFLSRAHILFDCCGVLRHPTKIEVMRIFSEDDRSPQPVYIDALPEWNLISCVVGTETHCSRCKLGFSSRPEFPLTL